jgi:hypothetical protein
VAAGIRIRHATETNVTYTLVDGRRPYLAPYECPRCRRIHEFKTYHIDLDDTGAAIVSQTVLGRLMSIPAHPFEIVDTVPNPPDIRVGVSGGQILIFDHPTPPIIHPE